MKGMWSDLLHFPVPNSSCNMEQFSSLYPVPQRAAFAEKFADFEFGVCNLTTRVWGRSWLQLRHDVMSESALSQSPGNILSYSQAFRNASSAAW